MPASCDKLAIFAELGDRAGFYRRDSYNLRLFLPAWFRGLEPHNNGQENMKNMIKKFWSDESGATAIEYGLIAAGISLAIIAVVNGLGTNLNGKFAEINGSLK